MSNPIRNLFRKLLHRSFKDVTCKHAPSNIEDRQSDTLTYLPEKDVAMRWAEEVPDNAGGIQLDALSYLTENDIPIRWAGATPYTYLTSAVLGTVYPERNVPYYSLTRIWEDVNKSFINSADLLYTGGSGAFNWGEYSGKIIDYSWLVQSESDSIFPAGDQVKQGRETQEEQKQDFLRQLSLLFETIDFEYGIKNEVDDYLEEYLKWNASLTKEWLGCFYLLNFSNIADLVKLLRTIARIDYQDIYPLGQLIATSALSHEDAEVKECGVRAFESWASLASLDILEHLKVPEKWLQEYIDEVVNYLRRDFNVTISKED